jgi:sulfur carrier protein ThiS adenylyltransferase
MTKKQIDNDKRYERQSDIFNGSGLNVIIIGVGAVGRQVALQLSAMGVESLTLVDNDSVEEVNLCAQGFREKDLGSPKVDAVKKACWELNSNTSIVSFHDLYQYDMLEEMQYIFCCVDNMATRKAIAEESDANQIIFDSRMAARVCGIKTIDSDMSFKYYMDEMFTDDEMVQETCTAKTTLFCANICAGLMVSQFVRKCRGENINHDICFDMTSMTFFIKRKADKTFFEQVKEEGEIVDTNEQERKLAEKDLAEELM